MAALTAIRMPENFEEFKRVEIVDQLLLPHHIRYERFVDHKRGESSSRESSVASVEEAWQAIRTMKIRGAPAIASLAALGIACELLKPLDESSTSPKLLKQIEEWTAYLQTSRPTAVNLREGMDRIRKAALNSSSFPPKQLQQVLIDVCKAVWSDDIDRNYAMGDHGAQWLLQQCENTGAIAPGGKINILTVCNTGSLATSAYGTAIGMVTSLHSMGRLEHAFFAQTVPYQQGARLTSLELQLLKIPSTMVPDTAIAALLQGKTGYRIHGFIAGADRIAANGDTANKISTFQISTLCKAIPMQYMPSVIICAPLTTLDLTMDDGSSIVIEERPEIEACTASGRLFYKDRQDEEHEVGAPITVLVTPTGTRAWNPAFDVTPARLIDAIVTEVGVAQKATNNEFDLRQFVLYAKPQDRLLKKVKQAKEHEMGATSVEVNGKE